MLVSWKLWYSPWFMSLFTPAVWLRMRLQASTVVGRVLGVPVGIACPHGMKRRTCASSSRASTSQIRRKWFLSKPRGTDLRESGAGWLVHLYEELGPAFFKNLNGWFSGLVLDLREKKVILFNDRYGVNRIYYHETQKGFYFASEAKALLKVLPETRQLDNQGLGDILSCGCVMQDRTLFRGIRLLPVASAWAFSAGRQVGKEQYFRAEEWENQSQLTPSEFYDSLKAVWTKRLPLYLNGNEPVALSMTGGVDSRMILAAAKTEPGKLPCYTFGGMYRDCADVKISRAVTRICQQPHETIALDRTFLSEFPALAAKVVYITDGTLDVTGATDLYVHRRARQIAPVRMSGLNGGEILRRLIMFKPRVGMGATSSIRRSWSMLKPPRRHTQGSYRATGFPLPPLSRHPGTYTHVSQLSVFK